jgi:biopolymer transport protein ExbD
MTPAGGGGPAKEIVKVAAVAKGTGAIEELAKALPPATSGDTPVILQADQDTPSSVIVRIIETAKAAGYNNVLFAVKNR